MTVFKGDVKWLLFDHNHIYNHMMNFREVGSCSCYRCIFFGSMLFVVVTIALDEQLCVYEELISLSCIGGESFETSPFHLSFFKYIIWFKIGYAHGTHYPKSHIGLCKVSLAHPS